MTEGCASCRVTITNCKSWVSLLDDTMFYVRVIKRVVVDCILMMKYVVNVNMS